MPDHDRRDVGWNFNNTYAELPKILFEQVEPARFASPRVSVLNYPLADQLGLSLNKLPEEDAASLFSGQRLPHGAFPIAQAYAGHQFGGFTMLGDGRAILVGEQCAPCGQLFDIQFKGSGKTPFSRRGDGKAALGPMLREYIISEAMHALGIPTTRSLAVVTTGEPVYRDRALRGAVLTRVASSHVRVGTFQFLAARQDNESLRALADYTIARHDPDLLEKPPLRYLKWLRTVMDRQASLIAQWQLVGFIHGVMNTDNVALSGETIDYGPCAFMDTYHPGTVFSSIDYGGRYAYGNQPAIGQWSLARFAETQLPLLDPDQNTAVEMATEILHEYSAVFERYWLTGMRKKIGLQTESTQDHQLITDLLDWMQTVQADFTNTFHDLSSPTRIADGIYQEERFLAWHARWQQRLADEGPLADSSVELMRTVNPSVIPRNHRVEEALAAATDNDDPSVMHRLLQVLSAPYQRTEMHNEFQAPPPPSTLPYQTFCGT